MKLVTFFIFFFLFSNHFHAKPLHQNDKDIVSLEGGVFRVFIRFDGEKPTSVSLCMLKNGVEEKKQMVLLGEKGGESYFYVETTSNEEFEYYFYYESDGKYIFNSLGSLESKPEEGNFIATNLRSGSPLWLKEASIYQLLIDRFNKSTSSLSNELSSQKYSRWDSLWNCEDSDEKYFRIYGGNVAGIVEKLDYIKSFADTIYISSPFGALQRGRTDEKINEISHSNHKFDVSHFEHISPDICDQSDGFNISLSDLDRPMEEWTKGDLEFFGFIKLAHEKGLRVILFFPLLYTSRNSPYFDDIAIKGRASKFFNWYHVDVEKWDELLEYDGISKCGVKRIGRRNHRPRWLDPYLFEEKHRGEIVEWNKTNLECKTFDDKGVLPLLNLNNPKCKEHVISSLKKWIIGPNGDRSGIDGITADIPQKGAEELVLSSIKKELTSLKKEFTFILNPLFPDELSSSLENISDISFVYRYVELFRGLLWEKKEVDGETFRLEMELLKYRSPNLTMAPISSWDISRAFSLIINKVDESKGIRPDLVDPMTIELFKTIVAIQFTFFDILVVYYGDEVGIHGLDDPDNRKPMLWEGKNVREEVDKLKKYGKIDSRDVQILEARDEIRYKVEPNQELRSFFTKISEIRRDLLPHKGRVNFLKVKGSKSVLSYTATKKNGELVVVVVNLSQLAHNVEISINESGKFMNLITDEKDYAKVLEGSMKLKVEPFQTLILG